MISRSQNLLLCLCLCFCDLSSTDDRRHVVTSIVRMSQLAQFEQDLVSFARQGASQLPQQFVNFVSSVEEEYARTYEPPLSFIDFPVNQYRLIRRFSFHWPLWLRQLRLSKDINNLTGEASSSPASEFLTFYKKQSKVRNKIDKFEIQFDLQTAVISITRLHILYRHKTGLLPNEDPTKCPPLSEMELLELCTTLLNDAEEMDNTDYAVHWMTLFIDRMQRHLPYSSMSDKMKFVFEHTDTYGKPDHYRRIFMAQPGFERLVTLTYYMRKFPQYLKEFYQIHDESLETQVCRSSGDRSESGNYCFMFHTPRAPYAPFKYEILHRDPYVAVVHNFMPLQTTQYFISTAVMSGSSVNYVSSYSPGEGRSVDAVEVDVRLSESTVFDPYHPVNAWLDLRVEHATLLQPHSQPMPHGVRDGEANHILHYGLSGHFRAHHDHMEIDAFFPTQGNRLATVLVYLTDVHSGGHTAFPHLNVSLTPRTGSALVWFNLDPLNGTGLPGTLHVACPVNVGKKWVINRWIRSHLKTGHLRPVVK